MLIRGNPSEEDAATFAERMQGQIGEPCKMNGREATVSCSIGIAHVSRSTGRCQELIAHADAAMHAAKSGGGADLLLLRAAHGRATRATSSTCCATCAGRSPKASCELFYQPKIARAAAARSPAPRR